MFWHFGLKNDSNRFFCYSTNHFNSALFYHPLFLKKKCVLPPAAWLCVSLSSPQCIFVFASAGARQRQITALTCLLITADDELWGGEATVKVQQDSPAAQQHKHICSFVVQRSASFFFFFFFVFLLIDGVTASVGGVFLFWQLAPSVCHSWEDKCETLHLFVLDFVTVRS